MNNDVEGSSSGAILNFYCRALHGKAKIVDKNGEVSKADVLQHLIKNWGEDGTACTISKI